METHLQWIDAHAHLTDPRMDKDLERLLREANALGITGWILAGTEPQEWKSQLELLKRLKGQVFPVFGLHPWQVHQSNEEAVVRDLELLKNELPFARALGETGLDTFKERATSLKLQQFAFEAQLELATEQKKPLVLHIVQAHSEARAFLKAHYRGIVHSFSGNAQDAKYYCDRGFLISFSGTLTRPGHLGAKEAVRALPLEKIVIETDAPDQKPHNYGKPINEPASLILVAEAVAQIKGVSKEEVLDCSTRNLRRLLEL